jgi:hypothetical protein
MNTYIVQIYLYNYKRNIQKNLNNTSALCMLSCPKEE